MALQNAVEVHSPFDSGCQWVTLCKSPTMAPRPSCLLLQVWLFVLHTEKPYFHLRNCIQKPSPLTRSDELKMSNTCWLMRSYEFLVFRQGFLTRQGSFSYFATLAMAFFLTLNLSNMQVVWSLLFHSWDVLTLTSVTLCLNLSYKRWTPESCLLNLFGFGSATPLFVTVSPSFQVPFDVLGNSVTPWFSLAPFNFSRGNI